MITSPLLPLLAISALLCLVAYSLSGPGGVLIAVGLVLVLLMVVPQLPVGMLMRMMRAQPVPPQGAPQLYREMALMAGAAGLPSVPVLYHLASPHAVAFTVGSPGKAAIAVSDGLLRTLSLAELRGVIGHEMAHVAANDTRLMQVAQVLVGLTRSFAQVGLLAAAIMLLFGGAMVPLGALLMLAVAPFAAMLLMLWLSRMREFAADARGASLCGDPLGLASALIKVERAARRSLLRGAVAMPGMEPPAYLRTHPPTRDRIQRLLAHPAAQARLASLRGLLDQARPRPWFAMVNPWL